MENTGGNSKPQIITQITTAPPKVNYQLQEAKQIALEPPSTKEKKLQGRSRIIRK